MTRSVFFAIVSLRLAIVVAVVVLLRFALSSLFSLEDSFPAMRCSMPFPKRCTMFIPLKICFAPLAVWIASWVMECVTFSIL